jgi:hypothetical protein
MKIDEKFKEINAFCRSDYFCRQRGGEPNREKQIAKLL